MNRLSLLTVTDIQQQLAQAVKERRRQMKLSRRLLAERSTVPEATIKKFESSGQISLRQFLLLWQCVDQLERLSSLSKPPEQSPRSIAEVLKR